MKRVLVIAGIVCLLLVAQSALLPALRLFGVAPDLLFVFLIFWSAGRRRWEGAAMGFITGLLQDLTLGGTVGIFAFAKTLSGFLCAWIPWHPRESNPLMSGMILFSIGLAHQIIVFGLGSSESTGGFGRLFLRYGLPSLVYTLVAGLAFYVISTGFQRWLYRNRDR